MDLEKTLEFGETIGQGGTAVLFQGFLKKTSEVIRNDVNEPMVAIKIPQKTATPAEIDFFMFEIAIMSNIPKSRHLVEFIGYSDKPLAIIMKFYAMSLKQLLTLKGVSDVKMVNLKAAFDICNGMKMLHEAGILHLDLKTGKKFYRSKQCNVLNKMN